MVLFRRARWLAGAWLVVWVPLYTITWGPRNFLNLCDVAMLLTCVGVVRGSALLLSSQALPSFLIGGLWVADVGARLIGGKHLLGGTEYMFDGRFPLAVRLMSLF